MNRYTSMSTGSFKPLDLQTIMMIPMAKQKQHDEAQSAANEYAALQASSLEQDREAVTGRLESLRGEANKITATLLDRGVDRNTMAKLNELKRAKEKEFGQQGLIGNAQANYSSASAFVKDLTEKKERQAGWSPSEAKKWAQAQVSSFKGTDAGEGKFNSFSGKELEDYVDTNKWINDNIAKVAADTDPIMLQKYGTVAQFETAWKSGTVEHKDASKIIKALALQAQYDHKLQASLKQSSAFSGEKDPTNIGEYQIVKKDGVSKEVFVPKSYFGAQLLGAATGAAYRKEDAKYTMVTDHVGIAMMNRGLDEKAANDMVIAADSGLLDIPPVKYEDLKSNLGIAKGEVDSTSYQLRKKAEVLKGKGIDPRTDDEWNRLNNANQQAGIKYQNLSSNLNAIYERSNAGMNNIDRRRVAEGASIDTKIDNMIKNAPSFGEKLRGFFSGELVQRDYRKIQEKKLGLTDDQRTKLSMMVIPNESAYKFEVKKLVMLNKGLLFPKNGNVNKAYGEYLDKTDSYEKKAKNYLKDNPAAASYQTFDGSSTGKYASVTGAAQKALTDSFNARGGQGWKEANSGASLDEFRDAQPKGTKYYVMPTNGYDLAGNPIETLVAKDKDGTFLAARAITRGEQGKILQRQVGQSLVNSGAYKNDGDRMIKNSYYAGDVGGMGIHQQSFSHGVIPNQETKDGQLLYVEKIRKEDEGSESFVVYKIDKDRYNKSGGKDVVKSKGLPAGGVDAVIDILDAYQR